jgi:pilus assembly protein Flp/PilA
MKNLVARFVNDESGAAAIEYAMIAALIGLAIAVGATTLGGAINTKLTNIGNTLNGTPTP